MKKNFCSSLLGVALLAAPGAANAVLINFDYTVPISQVYNSVGTSVQNATIDGANFELSAKMEVVGVINTDDFVFSFVDINGSSYYDAKPMQASSSLTFNLFDLEGNTIFTKTSPTLDYSVNSDIQRPIVVFGSNLTFVKYVWGISFDNNADDIKNINNPD